MTASTPSAPNGQPAGRFTAQQLREWIDCCRPGRQDDLAELTGLTQALAEQPEWQAYAEQSQQWDRSVIAAMEQVEVPAGLQSRVLAALAVDAAAGGEADATMQSDSVAEPAPAGLRIARRRWLLLSSALTATAASVALVMWWQTPTTSVGYEEVLDRIEMWQVSQTEAASTLLADQAPPRGWVPPSDVVIPSNTRWNRVRNVIGRDGVVYELAAAGAPRATLLVLEGRGTPQLVPLPMSPPRSPRTTHNRSAAVWTDGKRLFVLVVEGDAGLFRSYLATGGSIA